MNVTKSQPPHPFNAGMPIEFPDQDKLGRNKFAENIANKIIAYDDTDPIVIGIYGDWGFGKTSVLNLVKHYLQPKGSNNLILIDFNPWLYSNTEQPIGHFFSKIGKTIGLKDKSEQARKSAAFFEELSNYCGVITAIIPISLMRILWTVLCLIISITTLSYSPILKLFSIPLIVIALLSGLAVWSKRVTDAFKNYYVNRMRRKQRTLEEIRSDLEDELKDIAEKIVVFIDDIDRLTLHEIRLMFQAIKCICDLPKMIFVVAFDENQMAKSLEDRGFSGSDYLEKIVSHPIPISMPDRNKLQEYLGKELNKVLAFYSDKRWDSERWRSVYLSGFSEIYLRYNNPRKIIRSITELLLNVEIVNLEVNPIDYICIETIKVFYPELYRLIYLNKMIFLGNETETISAMTDDLSGKTKDKKIVDELENIIDAPVKELLQEIFPAFNPDLPNEPKNVGSNSEWHNTQRICSRYYFNNYFLLGLSSGQISQVIFDDFVENKHTTEGFEEILNNAIKTETFIDLVTRLPNRIEEINYSGINNMTMVLFNISSQFSRKDAIGLDNIPGHLFEITKRLLSRLGPDTAINTLSTCIRSSSGIYLSSYFVAIIESDIKKGETKNLIISPEYIDSLKRACVDKYEASFKDDTFAQCKDLAYPLGKWKKWASELGRDTFISLFIEKLSERRLVGLLGEFIYPRQFDEKSFDIDSLALIADPLKIENRIISIDRSQYNDDELETIDMFRAAFHNMRNRQINLNNQ